MAEQRTENPAFHPLAQIGASTEGGHSRTQKTISGADNVNVASTTRVEQNGNDENDKLNEVTGRSSFLVSRLPMDADRCKAGRQMAGEN